MTDRESESQQTESQAELPATVIEDVTQLGRRARGTGEDERTSYLERCNQRLAEYAFTTRLRSDGNREVLVIHPAEWLEDGRVDTEQIDDLDRAIEVPLSGPGDPDRWEELDTHNRELVAAVSDEHGPIHAANAERFADFIGNHYAKRVERATDDEIQEFLEEYYPRNTWPDENERQAVERSVDLLLETARTGLSDE